MSTNHLRASGPVGGVHPAVFNRRLHDLVLIGATALVPLALALGVTVAVPNPNYALVFGAVIGVLLIAVLVFSTRLAVTVSLLTVYLGCFDGPVKLVSGGGEATAAIRNVLIGAVCVGLILRLLADRQPVKLPPLFGWVLGYVVLVLAEAFNPNTEGTLKAIAGFRQQLQWIPFFFFGYLLMRSTDRFRKMFLIIGVIALANAAAATIQTRLSQGQLASLGPGYSQRAYGNSTTRKGARVYISEGVGRVRPLALGSDSGFGGSVGVIALPCSLALFALWRGRRRWVPAVLCLGAMVAVATSLGRLQVGGAIIALFSFAALSSSAGRQITRPLAALLVIGALAIPAGVLFVSSEEQGVFSRYEKIDTSKVAGYKEASLAEIPKDIKAAPFGFGLGVSGAASTFGGRTSVTLEGHRFSSETQYNWITDELGLPGLILWVALSLRLLVLIVRRLGSVADVDLRIALIGVFSAFIAFFVMGFKGPIMSSAAAGPFFWFATGIAAYWFVGPGRRAAATVPAEAT